MLFYFINRIAHNFTSVKKWNTVKLGYNNNGYNELTAITNSTGGPVEFVITEFDYVYKSSSAKAGFRMLMKSNSDKEEYLKNKC